MPIHSILSRISNAYNGFVAGLQNATHSYSQYGEDIIVANIIDILHIKNPTYLDIGAHHPTRLSNTYLLYRRGAHGVCIEPDPTLFPLFARKRSRDTCVPAADFYIMSAKTLNTFSHEEAKRCEATGTCHIKEIIKIPLISVNEIVKKYFCPFPNFVSVDVEGLDFEVLRSFDLMAFRPEVFCVETISYGVRGIQSKDSNISDYMANHGYFTFADTHVNTIFVDRDAWSDRRPNASNSRLTTDSL